MKLHKIETNASVTANVLLDDLFLGASFARVGKKYSDDLVNIGIYPQIIFDWEGKIDGLACKCSPEISLGILRKWLEQTPVGEIFTFICETFAYARTKEKGEVEFEVEMSIECKNIVFNIETAQSCIGQVTVPLLEVLKRDDIGELNCDWLLTKFLEQSLIKLKNA